MINVLHVVVVHKKFAPSAFIEVIVVINVLGSVMREQLLVRVSFVLAEQMGVDKGIMNSWNFNAIGMTRITVDWMRS